MVPLDCRHIITIQQTVKAIQGERGNTTILFSPYPLGLPTDIAKPNSFNPANQGNLTSGLLQHIMTLTSLHKIFVSNDLNHENFSHIRKHLILLSSSLKPIHDATFTGKVY